MLQRRFIETRQCDEAFSSLFVLTVGALLFLYPFVWMLAAHLNLKWKMAGSIFFHTFHVENYRFVLTTRFRLFAVFGNSLFVSIIVTASVVLSVQWLVTLSRPFFRGREMIFNLALATMMIRGAAHADSALHDDG